MKYTTLAVALLSSVAIQAQSPLSGMAHGFVINNQGNRTLKRKPAGDQPVEPFYSVTASTPDYSIDALLHHLGSTPPSHLLHMNSMSTGNDILPVEEYVGSGGTVDHYRVFSPQGALWAALAFTVDGYDTIDKEPGSLFDHRASSSQGIGSDLFSYWFSTNAGLPDSLVDTPHFEVGFEHMGLTGNEQVSALDTYMPAILEDRNSLVHLILQYKDRWYFTLTPDSANDIANNWSTFAPAFACNQQDIRANHVYVAKWNQPGMPNSWSTIDIRFRPDELGLSANDAIDAIAFYEGFEEQIVFSLAKRHAADNREQIWVGGPMVFVPQEPGGKKPLRDGTGARVTTKVGVGELTEVDSLCTYDPEILTDYYGPWIAFPVADPANEGTAADIGCSAARYRVASGQVVGQKLRVQATRLP
ncbi:hypothetical protein, partial [Ilumatobacter sp.]|uniref:hypothetical protein n=1 Tax=Ilumatobacter sp. TaxID=1967498 RepID=UPI003F6BB1B0